MPLRVGEGRWHLTVASIAAAEANHGAEQTHEVVSLLTMTPLILSTFFTLGTLATRCRATEGKHEVAVVVAGSTALQSEAVQAEGRRGLA